METVNKSEIHHTFFSETFVGYLDARASGKEALLKETDTRATLYVKV